MRRTGTLVLLSGFLVIAGLVTAPTASACSCVGGTTQEFFDRADAVFTARLVIREDPPLPITSSADPALHVFAVDTVYKGTAHREQGVVSPVSGATCGLELVGHGPFVVFAGGKADLGGEPFTTLQKDQYAALRCGGTAPLTPVLEAELAALAGPSAPPADPLPGTAGIAGTAGKGLSPLVPAVVGAGAFVLLLAGGLLLRRRRRRGERVQP